MKAGKPEREPPKLEPWMLLQRQTLPLEAKVAKAEIVIREFYEAMRGDVYVAFSGGKDSTVLLHLVRSLYPNVPAVFVNTGLEYPEIIRFVRSVDNVIWLKPDLTYKEVIEKHGYPVVSKKVSRQIRMLRHPTPQNARSRHLYLTGKTTEGKDCKNFILPKKWRYLVDAPFEISDKCCHVMKGKPLDRYSKETGRHPIIGLMASDSSERRAMYLKTGCNIMEGSPRSKPLSIWMEKDIWEYIKTNNLRYSEIYDMGVARTGCIFCAFGAHLEKPENRFQRLYRTHPELHKYCMEEIGMESVLDYIGVKSIPDTEERDVKHDE